MYVYKEGRDILPLLPQVSGLHIFTFNFEKKKKQGMVEEREERVKSAFFV